MSIKKYSKLRDSCRDSLVSSLPLRFPLSIYVETTNRCNFRCRYCPVSLESYPEISGGFKTMSLSEFKKICCDVQAGGRLKVLRFYFMGEPLLNPHLPEMIKTACRMNLAERTELTTNAVLLNKEKQEAIIKSGLDYLRISISSVGLARHKYITQTNVRPESVYNNVKEFRRTRDKMGLKKPFLYIKMIDSLNNAENARFLRIYKTVGDEAVIEEPMNWDGYGGHDFIGSACDKKGAVDKKKLYPYFKTVCPFPFYSLVVSVNGDVTVCCVDWNKATRVGNVFKDTLKSIWDGDSLRSLRRAHILRKRSLNVSCRNCQFLYTVPDNLDDMPKNKIEAVIGRSSPR